MKPRVIFENEHVIALNKHAHASFHGSQGQKKGYFQTMKEVLMDEVLYDQPISSLYPVHRLDAVTSGVLVLAKTKDVASHMQHVMARDIGSLDKYYVALSDKKPRQKMGTITGDIVKGRNGSYKLSRSYTMPSRTAFVSHKVDMDAEGPFYAFLVKPITGKTHQIRVVMKSLGSPVAGDARYGSAASAKEYDRGYLHCTAMRFTVYDQMTEIFCAPEEGVLFNTTEFKEMFYSSEWFCFQNTQKGALWFPTNSILKTKL